MSELLVNTIKKADGTGSLTIPADTGTVVIKDGSNDVTLNNITATGVYLGGTGAANYLDDYEEGTWTPTINQGGSSLTATNAFYTKIGRIVFISFALTDISSPVASRLQINGLPFTQGASLNLQGMYVTYDDTGAPADTVILISNGLIYFTRQGTATAVNGTSFNFSGSNQIRLSGSYLTTS